jgi:hypothetical protein
MVGFGAFGRERILTMPFAGNQPMDPDLFGTDGTLASALGQADVQPTTDVQLDMPEALRGMTGEQYALHFQYVLRALKRLSWKVPQTAREISAGTYAGGVVDAVVMAARAAAAMALVSNAVAASVDVVGRDWPGLIPVQPNAALDRRSAAVVAQRLSKADPSAVQDWYLKTTQAISTGFDLIQAQLDEELRAAAEDEQFWATIDALLGLPLKMIENMLLWLGQFAGSVLGAAGEGLGAAAGGIAFLIWSIAKPLILPALLVGAAYVGWTQRHRIHAALTGRGGSTVPGDGDVEAETKLLPAETQTVRFRRR